jgi:hypothetical protein
MTDEDIRKGILADPDDAHPTDEAFWKNAKLVAEEQAAHR